MRAFDCIGVRGGRPEPARLPDHRARWTVPLQRHPAHEPSSTAVDGRLLVMIAKDPRAGEPRFQINDGATGQLIFGVDVDGLEAGRGGDASTARRSASRSRASTTFPAGTYSVQALLHKYETFKRGDGHTVKMPMDRGEGQQWARAPGNLYSTPQTITFDPKQGGTIAITLDQMIAPLPAPKDTKYVKHERIQSERLTKFWGRPMHLGAHVLLPEGWDTHPDARYPLFIYHGHFPADLTELARDAAGSEPQARLLGALQLEGLQPHAAGVRAAVLSRTGPARTSRARS